MSVILLYSAKFSQYLSERKTVDGIWFLVLITYVYTADTCLNLLRCVQVYEPIEFKGKRVSRYKNCTFGMNCNRCTTLMEDCNVSMENILHME